MNSTLENKEHHIDLLYSKPFFELELTSYCNMKCLFCPRTKIERKMGMMDENTFKSIIDKIPSRSKVMFSGMGEPFLNPNIIDYLRLSKMNGNIIGITTNGSLLNEEMINQLSLIEIDLIQFSLPTMDREKYIKMMGGDFLEQVIKNISRLNERKNPKTEIRISIIYNHPDEIEDEIIHFADLNDIRLFTKKKHSRGGNLYKKIQLGKFRCGIFPKITFISWSGEVLLCCHDIKGNINFGKYQDLGLKEILIQKDEFLMKGEFPDLCEYCDDEYRYTLYKDASDLE